MALSLSALGLTSEQSKELSAAGIYSADRLFGQTRNGLKAAGVSAGTVSAVADAMAGQYLEMPDGPEVLSKQDARKAAKAASKAATVAAKGEK